MGGGSTPTDISDGFGASDVERSQRTEEKCQLCTQLDFSREAGREIGNLWISGQLTLGLGELTITRIGQRTDRDDNNRTGPIGSDANRN